MRTSRVSRETARVVNALSPSRRTGVRRSLRGAAQQSELESVEADKSDTNGSDFSSTASSTLGKRKREPADNLTTSTTSETTTVRRSPRKETVANNATSTRKPRRQPAKHIKGPNGNLTVEPPANWTEVYNTTAAMRKRIIAPVDTMGCESLAETHRSPRDQRLQTLVSLMLSSQTKDTVTAAAMKNLQENLVPGGLCLEALLEVEPEELNRLIEKVGFHNNKTKHIKAVAKILRDEYGGDIPDSIEGLIALPGVGPKMVCMCSKPFPPSKTSADALNFTHQAYLCMSAAWGRDEGIGVDVHVHRITNLWGWHKTSTPEQTRAELEAWLPRDKWHEINHLLVGLGQTICLPVGRKCGECDLAAKRLCPGAQVTKSPVKEKKEVGIEMVDGEVVKKEEVVVLSDDVGVKVEANLEDEGDIEMQAAVGAASGDDQGVNDVGRKPPKLLDEAS